LRGQFLRESEAQEQARIASETQRHTGELQKLLDELRWAENARRIDRLEDRFNAYIDANWVNRTDATYSTIIEDFEDTFEEKSATSNEITNTPRTSDTPRTPQNEVVNTDLEAAQRRAMTALRAAEIEIVLHFDDANVIAEKMAIVHWILRTKANDRPFLVRTIDFRASFAGSLGIPEIRSMQAIGVELWRIRKVSPGFEYANSQALTDAIRNTTDPSALHAIGENIRRLRITR
jgi:hypothetical protein